MTLRGLARAVLPGGLALAAALATVVLVPDETLELVTGRYAVVLYAAGAILAGVFHRSRVVTALAGVAGLELFGGEAAAGSGPFVPLATVLMGLLGTLALVRDRGALSRGGLAQLAGAGVVAYLAYVVLRDPERVAAFWEAQVLPVGLPAPTELPQATVVVGGASVLAVLFGWYRWRGPVERALVWSQLVLIASVLPQVSPPETSFLHMCVGLVLSVSVLETSYSMAYLDELTGLPARRALFHDLEQMGGGTYTVAMVDVDHFKKFNDKYGHDVGDQVLKLVATRLADGPGGGRAYRYGGEEFTLVYPGRAKDEALSLADAVRAAVDKAGFSLRAWNRPRKRPTGAKSKRKRTKTPKKLSVTVSVGLADSSAKGSEPETVLKRADEALYQAKRGGRNRVA